jgi:hypothetical protein
VPLNERVRIEGTDVLIAEQCSSDRQPRRLTAVIIGVYLADGTHPVPVGRQDVTAGVKCGRAL